MLSVEDENAWKVLPDGRVERRPIGEIRTGDEVEAHTGEKLAVDGVITSGAAVIDQSAITGEFEPAEKAAGDEVFAGTVVKSGSLRIRVAKVGDQTVVSRIVGMVEASELKKAPIQRYADRFSNYLVPLNFLLCLTVWLVTRNPQKALKMLVIDYSCGIKLSTATAFSAAINTAVRKGVLIKGGAYIEQMSNANTVLLDKTGTITEGKPQVVSMQHGTRAIWTERAALSHGHGRRGDQRAPVGERHPRLWPQAGRGDPRPWRDRHRGLPRQSHGCGRRGGARGQPALHGGKRRAAPEEAMQAQWSGAIATYVGVDKSHHRGALRHGQAARERAPRHQQPALRRRGRCAAAHRRYGASRRALVAAAGRRGRLPAHSCFPSRRRRRCSSCRRRATAW